MKMRLDFKSKHLIFILFRVCYKNDGPSKHKIAFLILFWVGYEDAKGKVKSENILEPWSHGPVLTSLLSGEGLN